MIGLLAPTSGTLAIGPHDLVAHPEIARQLCSYLPQAQMPIDAFRASEAIEITGRIRGGDMATVRARTGELIDALGIEEWRSAMGVKLSGGVRPDRGHRDRRRRAVPRDRRVGSPGDRAHRGGGRPATLSATARRRSLSLHTRSPHQPLA